MTNNAQRRRLATIVGSVLLLLISAVHVLRNTANHSDGSSATIHTREEQQQELLRHGRRLQEEPEQQQQQQQAPQEDRPPIYTYYHRVEGTGMTEQSDDALLSEWKRSWYNAGWEPKVLTLEDARQHPNYQTMMDLITDPALLGDYELMCYLRWVAMSAPHINGGWMADYDTFPLNPFLRHGRQLPENGALVVYGQNVPALVSGRASEYFRLAQRIGESFQRHVAAAKQQPPPPPPQNLESQEEIPNNSDNHPKMTWSDMKALGELSKWNENSFIRRREVLGGEAALTGTTWGPDECRTSWGMRAVHFSHRAVTEGKQAYRGFEHRPTVARQWINMWNTHCEISYVQD
eukprot:CAMPEP_0195308066 /NCGR_PEP_ID=MMETSP0707-20130614/38035_1 /TAXON_ID=33640 /ORGANISM="Asterionellopsis glacialis, Strain CCMP134" /LENGTH=347 /DNA_ID=CAMNT_0040372325 /DNA_START=94 /DNA_END=1137 /DNA_ORIENTATION=-